METFNWQWLNGGVREDHPEYDLLPSEYFERQIYGLLLGSSAQSALNAIEKLSRQHPVRERLPAPRPASTPVRAPRPRCGPRDFATETLSGLSEDTVIEKILFTATLPRCTAI